MPPPSLQLGATVLCSHGGVATPLAPFPRVLLSGQPAVTLASPFAIAGCALTGSGNPPCATAHWVGGAVRVMAGGGPPRSTARQSGFRAAWSPPLPPLGP